MHGSKCVFSLCLGLSYGYVVMSEFEWMHIFSGAYVVFFCNRYATFVVDKHFLPLTWKVCTR